MNAGDEWRKEEIKERKKWMKDRRNEGRNGWMDEWMKEGWMNEESKEGKW